MNRSLLSLFALAFSLPTAAQEVPGIRRVPTAGPPRFVRLELDTGKVEEMRPPPSFALSQFCYQNNIDLDPNLIPGAPLPSVLDALLFPAHDELFDWGIKGCGGSGFVDRIRIGYASMAPPAIGGDLTLRVYAGAQGFGSAGQLVAELHLTGLPSEGPPGTFLTPFMMTIDLGAQSFFLPDGPIGWSYENSDDLTAPLLVDVRIELGTQNYFDVYRPAPAPAGHLLGTFTLPPGGASQDPFENSFWIEIAENDVPGQAVPISAAGNPNSFVSLGPPRVGEGWDARLNLVAFPDATMTFAFVSVRRLFGTITPFGELLVDTSRLAAPISIQTGDRHGFAIPADSALLGRVFYAQGALLSLSQGLVLTNGFELTVGSL